MAYVNANPSANFFEIIRGYFANTREFREEEKSQDVVLLHEGKEMVGVRLRNVFDRHEILGAKGEEYVKAFLERNGVPHLYVGQGPTGVAKSEVLQHDLQAHRPDFLIHLPDLGTLFFDVKCRRKRAFSEKGDSCFYLFKGEMESLIKLHLNLFIPVWIAFIDSDFINRNEAKPPLYLVCVSQLDALWTAMKKTLTEREVQSLGVIRVPSALLHEVKEKLEFKIGVQRIQAELVDRYAELHSGFVRRVEDEVRAFIRKNPVVKTALPRKMISMQKLQFLLDADVTAAASCMIREGIIRFESGKPLTLAGE